MTFATLIAALVIAGLIGTVLGLLLLIFAREHELVRFVSKNAVTIVFVFSLLAMLGSLFFSNVRGYEVCLLGWFQRIFMYPLPFILGMALWKKDRNIIDYGLMLAVLGGLIAAYHYSLQFGFAPALPCSAIGQGVSCEIDFVREFGFVTLPLMSFTTFSIIALTMIAK